MQTSRLLPFALRDVAVAAAMLLLWSVALRAPDTAWGSAMHVAAGLATVLVGYLAHEWGHLLGALWRRSAVRLPDRLLSAFLFNFDVGCNNRAQFNAMVAGGFIASLLFVALALLLIPWEPLAGKIALTLTALGVAATFILEVPTAWRVFRGAPLPQQGPAFVSTRGDSQ